MDVLQFTLKNDDFQLIIIIAVTIQVAVLNRFLGIHTVGVSPHVDEPYVFWKQSVQQNH